MDLKRFHRIDMKRGHLMCEHHAGIVPKPNENVSKFLCILQKWEAIKFEWTGKTETIENLKVA